jgi:triosephosphate isomerase
MRVPFVAANWKMHKTVSEAVSYVTELKRLELPSTGVDTVIAPAFTAVHAASEAVAGTTTRVAGQDLHWEPKGAFTGSISAQMLKEAGATYVIIGHSERRHIFGETDLEVNLKIKAAIAHGLTPIICVGETLDEREANQTLAVLNRQLEGGLQGLTVAQTGEFIVAYEPVWAIGTGRVATPDQAQTAHAHIRSRLRELFTQDIQEQCRVIYGGSVNPSNVAELACQPDVDGSLVGGAGLEPKSFAEIVAKSAAATV